MSNSGCDSHFYGPSELKFKSLPCRERKESCSVWGFCRNDPAFFGIPLFFVAAQAEDMRDAVSKALYRGVFDWLVTTINDAIRPQVLAVNACPHLEGQQNMAHTSTPT